MDIMESFDRYAQHVVGITDAEIADQVKAIVDKIDASKLHIERADALLRLQSNPDYILLFEQHYLKEQALHWALALGNYKYTYTDQDTCIDKIKGIGQFHVFTESVVKFSNKAHQDIAVHQVELENILENS